MAQGAGWARRPAAGRGDTTRGDTTRGDTTRGDPTRGDTTRGDPTRRGELGARGLRVVSGEMYTGWEAIYQDNVERIYRLMFSKVGNRADAEDLTAEVFVAALGPLRVSASVGEVRAYLWATARTVLARHWRATMGREITTIDKDYPQPPAGETTAVSDAPPRADTVLRGLPERYRRILTLRFLSSYSVKDTAAAMGVSVANAKVLQHRALHRAAQLSQNGSGAHRPSPDGVSEEEPS